MVSKADHGKRQKSTWQAPQVKVLADEDLHKYSIFDVVMPLPGQEVRYPGGELGERYRECLKMDGLDPDNFERIQKCVNLCHCENGD
jgi:tRNA pseudouridine13 synthase